MEKHNHEIIHFSVAARDDLDRIYDTFLQECKTVLEVDAQIARLMDSADELAHYIHCYTLVSHIQAIDDEYFRFLVGEHVILYRVLNGDVYIDRIIERRFSFMQSLFGGSK